MNFLVFYQNLSFCLVLRQIRVFINLKVYFESENVFFRKFIYIKDC